MNLKERLTASIAEVDAQTAAEMAAHEVEAAIDRLLDHRDHLGSETANLMAAAARLNALIARLIRKAA